MGYVDGRISTMGLHARTAVARLPLRQLGFLVLKITVSRRVLNV